MLEESELSRYLTNIKKQFLCATTVKSIQWQSDLLHGLYGSKSCSLIIQRMLLENTVNDPLVKKFPLKQSYQLAFLKDIISKLEGNGQEVLDKLYVTYCNLLSSSDNDVDTHYRHFMVDFCGIECITLKESSTLISQGTTGLCSWQAASALADWCLHNSQFLHNKHILELGSGVGLTGLAVSLCCKPSSYLFSDCHSAVLSTLQSNILLNTAKQNCHISPERFSSDKHGTIPHVNTLILNSPCESLNVQFHGSEKHEQRELCSVSEEILRTKYNNTEIGVLNLYWENIPESEIVLQMSPTVILAADVVYDLEILPALCQAICHLLVKKACVLIMACTVRNEETLEAFKKLLSTEAKGLDVLEEKLPPPKYFLYSVEVPIKLYRITAGIKF